MISPTNALDGLKQTIVCGDLVGYDGICNQQYCMWMCLHHARQLPIRRGIMMISGFQGCLFSDKPRSHNLERDPICFFSHLYFAGAYGIVWQLGSDLPLPNLDVFYQTWSQFVGSHWNMNYFSVFRCWWHFFGQWPADSFSKAKAWLCLTCLIWRSLF